MAEFCWECLNKISNTDFCENDVVLSCDLDFCEECAEFKRVVVRFERDKFWRRFRKIFKSKNNKH